MGKVEDNLNHLLGLTSRDDNEMPGTMPQQSMVPAEKPSLPQPEEESKEVTDDFTLSRDTYRRLMEKGDQALDDLSKVAKESDSPRAYEVVATMIKTLTDTTKELMELHKRRKDIRKVDGVEPRKNDGKISVDKAVFIGRPDELLRQMKNEEDNG